MRRSVIIVLLLLVLVMSAGCSAGTNVTPTANTPEVTPPVQEKPDLVLDNNLKLEEVPDGMMATGTVTNRSAFAVGGIEIKFAFFDRDGKLLGTTTCSLPKGTTMAAGGIWQYEGCVWDNAAMEWGVSRTQVLASLTVK